MAFAQVTHGRGRLFGGTSRDTEVVDEEIFARLTSAAGVELIEQVHERAGVESDLALGTRLRRTHDPDLVAAAVTVNHLRGRAVTKFGDDAAAMFFTHDALEQSTRRTVAEHRAARLRATGARAVVDLGCGIGGDLIAFARAGLAVRGVERDPVRAAMARANLAALGLAGTVEVGDATTTEIGDAEVAFVDPARRDARGRVFTTAGLVPAWEFVTEKLAGRAVAKVMPGIAHGELPAGVEAEWVSDGGSLVEACLWGAGLVGGALVGGDPAAPAGRARRLATVLPAGASIACNDVEPSLGPIGQWLLEPDDAVIRAGAVTDLANGVGGHLIDRQIAWIGADTSAPTPFGRWFRVVEELPFREKALRAALRERDIGTLTVKKRGVDVVPEQLIKRLRLTGDRPGTVILTRAAGHAVALLADPAPRVAHT